MSLTHKLLTHFKPARVTERGALGNHKEWIVVKEDRDRVLIACTCHPHESQDLRWIYKEQLEEVK